MSDFEFRLQPPPDPSARSRRYAVFRHSIFIGEVFQFWPDVDTHAHRWLAQYPSGVMFGWYRNFKTRERAAETLMVEP